MTVGDVEAALGQIVDKTLPVVLTVGKGRILGPIRLVQVLGQAAPL